MKAGELTCRLVHNLADTVALAGKWDELLKRGSFNCVFASCGFARAWWRVYGRKGVLWIAVVEDSTQEVRLIAPLFCDPDSGQLAIICGQGSDYSQLVLSRDDRESMDCLFRFLRKRKDWRVFSASCIPDSELMHHFEWRNRGLLGRLLASPTLLRMPSSRQWRKMHPFIDRQKLESLSGLLQRSGHRKHVNWFNRQGTLTYSCATTPREITALLPDLFRLHMAEWSSRGGTSQFVQPENQQFYECLVEELGPSGAIRLDLLTLSGRIIAAHFGFLWAGRFYYYKPAFDPEFSSHSPGSLLLAHLLNQAAMQEVREFDLLFGVEPYKLNFASDIRVTGSIRVIRSWPCWLRLRAGALRRNTRRRS